MKILSSLNFYIVVASSFGCFYALHLQSVPKIIINPCLYPSVQIPKPTKTPANFVDEFSMLEKNLYSNLDESIRKIVFAIFGDSDELFR